MMYQKTISEIVTEYLDKFDSSVMLHEIHSHGIHNITNEFSDCAETYESFHAEFKLQTTRKI